MKRNFILILCSFALVVLIANEANAYQLKSGKFPSNLSDNLNWYVDASAEDYKSNIVKVLNWNSDPYYIIIGSEAGSTLGAELRFYYTGEDKGSIVAENFSYESSTDVYSYAIIKLYKGFGGLVSTKKNETIVHEVGHSVGLAHEDNISPAIMVSKGFIGKDKPQTDDWNGVEAKYK